MGVPSIPPPGAVNGRTLSARSDRTEDDFDPSGRGRRVPHVDDRKRLKHSIVFHDDASARCIQGATAYVVGPHLYRLRVEVDHL